MGPEWSAWWSSSLLSAWDIILKSKKAGVAAPRPGGVAEGRAFVSFIFPAVFVCSVASLAIGLAHGALVAECAESVVRRRPAAAAVVVAPAVLQIGGRAPAAPWGAAVVLTFALLAFASALILALVPVFASSPFSFPIASASTSFAFGSWCIT